MKKIFMILFLLLAGCNVLQEGDNLPVISASVLPSTAGSVLVSGQGSENQQVEVLAIANENWRFTGWSGDIESEENPLNITLTENTEIYANFILAGNEFRMDLQLDGGEVSSELSLGQIPGATDNFDTNIDLESPPNPPDGILYSWLESSDRRMLYDFRNPHTIPSEWVLNIEPGNSNLVLLAWEIQNGSISGSLILANSDGSLEVNMLEQSSAELTLPDETQFKILYSQ